MNNNKPKLKKNNPLKIKIAYGNISLELKELPARSLGDSWIFKSLGQIIFKVGSFHMIQRSLSGL